MHTMKRFTSLAIAALAICGVSGAAVAANLATAPVNTAAPTISGQPYVGKTLTATKGSWQNAPASYTYQWARCDDKGNGCVSIGGATSSTYVSASADVGHTVAVLVTATNSAGTAGPVSSKPTSVITPATKPTSTAAPTIVGQAVVGQQLVAQPGSYSGGAVASYAYEWQRCDPGNLTCTAISGAKGQAYVVVAADLGQRLRIQVTASNPFGHATTVSNASSVVINPVVVVTPTLTAARSTTICCQTVRLSGAVSPARSGAKITILGREFDALATAPVTTATTDANGNWSATVTPMIATTYTAQTDTATSSPMTVGVHPRIGFGVNGNVFTAKVTARDNFAGRIAFFQMKMKSGAWKRLALVVINQHSVAKFRVPLHRGHTYSLRIYLTNAQAGAGYLDGTSLIQRVGGVVK
jgi:hypothetical protein